MDSDAPPSAGFYNFLGWFETNKKAVAIGAGVVLFIGIVVGFFVWRSSEREMEAEEALSAVRTPGTPLEAAAPGTADSLLKIAHEYPKTPAAQKALLRAGSVYFAEGNYTKAREAFDTFTHEFGDTPWVPQAVFGLAACADAENKSTDAIAKYNDFLQHYSSDPSAEQARMNLVRLYEQTKQPALALELLNKMVGNPQQGYNPAAAEAQEKIRELYAKNPSLMIPATNPAIRSQPPQMQFSTNIAPKAVIVPSVTPATSSAPKILLNPGQPATTPGK